MNPLTPRTHDARGTLRPLCRPCASTLQPRPGEVLPDDLIRELRGRRTNRWIIPFLLAIYAAAIGALIVIARLPLSLLLIIVVPLLLTSSTSFLLRDYRLPFTYLHFHRRREAFLAAHRCPSCAYPLHTQPPDPDGCTVCPECGAAWLLPSPIPTTPQPHPS